MIKHPAGGARFVANRSAWPGQMVASSRTVCCSERRGVSSSTRPSLATRCDWDSRAPA